MSLRMVCFKKARQALVNGGSKRGFFDSLTVDDTLCQALFTKHSLKHRIRNLAKGFKRSTSESLVKDSLSYPRFVIFYESFPHNIFYDNYYIFSK